jgi:hypothetical protein
MVTKIQLKMTSTTTDEKKERLAKILQKQGWTY